MVWFNCFNNIKPLCPIHKPPQQQTTDWIDNRVLYAMATMDWGHDAGSIHLTRAVRHLVNAALILLKLDFWFCMLYSVILKRLNMVFA